MKINVNPETLSRPLSWFYRLWVSTIRVEMDDFEPVKAVWENGGTIAVACWHNELFIYPKLKMDQKWTVIVSQSKDGSLATALLRRLGLHVSQGSSSRGGVRALMGACRMMKKHGHNCVVTVDGPRGPRHKVKDGIFYLAQKSGSPIVPARVFCSRPKVFDRAWDNFELPLPFSTCRVAFGEPYAVPTEKLTEDVLSVERLKLEEKLNALG